MTDPGKSAMGGTSWLKYGCFGCLGLVGLVILIAMGLAGVALVQVRSEQVADRVLTPDLPVTAVAPTADGTEPVEAPGSDLPPAAGAPAVLEGVGTVVLELSEAEFEVVPGKPGERLHVEATYDANSYVLEETLETGEGPSWTYGVNFRRARGSGLLAALKELLGGTKPKVRVVLPVDLPLTLEARTSRGAMWMELGGLWLQTADLEFSQGGFELQVSEPLHGPMERFTINGSMGGFTASRLGNASPRRLEVDFGMGGMVLDLRGRWVADSDISITTSMGGSIVRLPKDVIIEGLDVDGPRGQPTDELRPPILRFSTSSSMGNLEFR